MLFSKSAGKQMGRSKSGYKPSKIAKKCLLTSLFTVVQILICLPAKLSPGVHSGTRGAALRFSDLDGPGATQTGGGVHGALQGWMRGFYALWLWCLMQSLAWKALTCSQ